MLRSDDLKNDSLYEYYCEVEDDYEKNGQKKIFIHLFQTRIIFLFYLNLNQ